MQFPSNNLTSENVKIALLRCHVGYENNKLINKQFKEICYHFSRKPKDEGNLH